jgi:hypothetical protein
MVLGSFWQKPLRKLVFLYWYFGKNDDFYEIGLITNFSEN